MKDEFADYAILVEQLIPTLPPEMPSRVDAVMNRLPPLGRQFWESRLATHRASLPEPTAVAVSFYETMAEAFARIGTTPPHAASACGALSDIATGSYAAGDTPWPYCVDLAAN